MLFSKPDWSARQSFGIITLMQVGASLEARLQAAWRLRLGPEFSACPEFCPAWTGCFISIAYVTMSIGIFVIRKVFKLFSKRRKVPLIKQSKGT